MPKKQQSKSRAKSRTVTQTGLVWDKTTIARNTKTIAAMSYCFVLCFFPLLSKRNEPFVQFHARQGLALFIIEILGLLLSMTVIFAWVGGLLLLYAMVGSLIGIRHALHGHEQHIPGTAHVIRYLNI